MKVRDDPNLNDTDEEMNALLVALTGLRKGDAKVRLPLDWSGVSGKVADVFNAVVEQNADTAEELARLRQVVGKEGKLKQRASLREARGFWGQSIECINSLIDDLVHPTSEVARVIGAVAQGDLSKSMALEVEGRPLEGEFLRTAKTINKMVEQLGNFSAEVTRVAREVGTEGKLGGQAKVKGVAGTWKDLTDSVNSMAGNLTDQVRNIADVTTAVAKGDLSKKIDVDVKGEFLDAEEHDQHDGRPAPLVRFGGDARRARGGHRRLARRPGARRGRLGDVEGPHRLRELDGRQPHLAGAQHRRRHQGRRGTATCRRRSPSTSRARSSS